MVTANDYGQYRCFRNACVIPGWCGRESATTGLQWNDTLVEFT